MAETADVVVVGGGVMGLSVAWQLAERKAGKVVLLEKSHLGAGSSGKSGAIIRQHYSHSLLVKMARAGLRRFENFDEIIGGPPVFTRAGLVLVAPPAERSTLETNVAMQQRLGVKVSLISSEETREIDPQLRLADEEDEETVAYESEAGYCDALQVVESLAQSLRTAGAEIREWTRATDIRLEAGRVSGVATPATHLSTRSVVLAAGPWAARLAGKVGVDLPVVSCRTQVALFRRPLDFGRPHPVYCDFSNEIYFRPTDGETTHVGNIDPREEQSPANPDDYPEVADWSFVREMGTKFVSRHPELNRGIVRGGYGALYSITPDWQPIIGRLPGVEGAYCAAGFSGHGFKLSPAVSEVVAELILDGSARSFDIRPLRPARFQEGELFTGKTASRVMG